MYPELDTQPQQHSLSELVDIMERLVKIANSLPSARADVFYKLVDQIAKVIHARTSYGIQQLETGEQRLGDSSYVKRSGGLNC